MLVKLLLIGLGGFLGACSRYLIGLVAIKASTYLPLGTLLVNVLGTFILSLVIFLGMYTDRISVHQHSWLAIGFCGSLTTMSTFIADSHSLFRAKGILYAFLNISLNLALCFLAFWLARWIIESLR